MTIQVQTDLRVTLPSDSIQKATLKLSETGDIEVCTGREKLAAQLTRAVVNDQVFSRDFINTKASTNRLIKTMITQVLRKMREEQIDMVNRSDPDLSGFKIYRKAAEKNENYRLVSTDPITWKYVDSDLENGITYDYGITRIVRNTLESTFLDKLSIAPTQFTSKQDYTIGSYVAAVPGNQQVTFYVDYNRRFKKAELLNSISNIDVHRNPTEPRKVYISVYIKDLSSNNLELSTKQFSFGES